MQEEFFRAPLGPTKACKRTGQAPMGAPIRESHLWHKLPGWFVSASNRGSCRRCWDGHRLLWEEQDGRRYRHCNVGECCHERPPAGEMVLVCSSCRFMVCQACNQRKRLPSLGSDPLFHGPRSPCLLEPARLRSPNATLGTVIVVPGGNYEFLSASEGGPIVDWLASHGIESAILRYRVLPAGGIDDAMDDLQAAAEHLRKTREGPVAAIGFSAGGHLIASLSLRAGMARKPQPLDAQVLVYPAIIVGEEDLTDYHGWDGGGFRPHKGPGLGPDKARALLGKNDDMLGGARNYSAPPTLVVASKKDTSCPTKTHTDPYVEALQQHDVEVKYVRRDFGDHGFGLNGGWTNGCITWLKKAGFGKKAPIKDVARNAKMPRLSTSSSGSSDDRFSIE